MKNWWHSLPDVHTQHVHLVVVVVPRSFSFSAASSSYPIHYLCDNIDMILFCQIFFLSGFVVVVVIRLWYLWKIEDDTELSLNLVKVTYGEREYGPVGGFFFYFRIHRREMTFFFFFAVCFLQSSCLSALWRMGMNIKHDEHNEKKTIHSLYIYFCRSFFVLYDVLPLFNIALGLVSVQLLAPSLEPEHRECKSVATYISIHTATTTKIKRGGWSAIESRFSCYLNEI